MASGLPTIIGERERDGAPFHSAWPQSTRRGLRNREDILPVLYEIVPFIGDTVPVAGQAGARGRVGV